MFQQGEGVRSHQKTLKQSREHEATQRVENGRGGVRGGVCEVTGEVHGRGRLPQHKVLFPKPFVVYCVGAGPLDASGWLFGLKRCHLRKHHLKRRQTRPTAGPSRQRRNKQPCRPFGLQQRCSSVAGLLGRLPLPPWPAVWQAATPVAVRLRQPQHPQGGAGPVSGGVLSLDRHGDRHDDSGTERRPRSAA